MKMFRKFIPSLAAVVAFGSLVPLPVVAEDLTAAFEAGKRAYYNRDFLTAKAKFAQVLEQYPNHVASRAMMRQVEIKLSSDTGRVMRAKLEAITLPVLELEEADLATTLEHLSRLAAEQSGGKFKPNFIIRGEGTAERLVTLKLRKIPLSEAIRYISELTKVNVTYEEYAAVITPLSTAADGGVKKKDPVEGVAGK